MKTSSLKEKISYGICAFGYELEIALTLSYFTLFCTDIMLISASSIGIMFLLTKVIDAISDILITNLADNTCSKYGKYRPWIIWMGIPLGIMTMVCYWNPSFLTTEPQKLLWVYAVYILLAPLFETGVMCPVMVMGTVMSEDDGDRLDFASARCMGENCGDILINAAAMPIILAFGSYKDIRGWHALGIIVGTGVIISLLTGFLGTKERIIVSNTNKDGEKLSLLEKFSLFKGNIPYLKLLCIHFSTVFLVLIVGVLFSYFCIYNLGHPEWVSVLSTIGVIVQLVSVSFVPKLGRMFEKRRIMLLGIALLLGAGILALGMQSYLSAVYFQILKGAGLGLLCSCIWSIWPEATDYTEWKTGIYAPGIVLAIGTFVFKLGGGFGNFFATTIVLGMGKYQADLEVQTESTMAWIRNGLGIGMLISMLIVLCLILTLKEFDRSQMERYKLEIAERKGISAENH